MVQEESSQDDARKAAEQELQLRSLLRQLLEPAANARLQNIRLSNPSLYVQVAQTLIYLKQSNRLPGRVTEEFLKNIVAQLLSRRKETKISFARK